MHVKRRGKRHGTVIQPPLVYAVGVFGVTKEGEIGNERKRRSRRPTKDVRSNDTYRYNWNKTQVRSEDQVERLALYIIII